MTKFVYPILMVVLIAVGCSGQSVFEPEIPESCKNQGFCEDVPNYPTEQVKKVVAELGDKVKYFQMDQLDDADTKNISRLAGDDTDQIVPLCSLSDKMIIYPESAPDKNNKWYTVINPKGAPIQGFRVEMCDYSSPSSCSPIATFQEGYKGSCKQQYVYRMMAVLDTDESFFMKSLKLPSCCSCVTSVVEF